jgi:hypothetical protein
MPAIVTGTSVRAEVTLNTFSLLLSVLIAALFYVSATRY